MAMWLSYANGANDNYKGVATLFGSDTTSYRQALVWGTATTFAGSLVAVLFAGRLVRAFSGHGVVPDALVGDPRLLFSVAAAAAAVVMVATITGLPISTTHALVGGLTGAGVSSTGLTGISWPTLGAAFAAPLLISPLMSGLIVAATYPRYAPLVGVSAYATTLVSASSPSPQPSWRPPTGPRCCRTPPPRRYAHRSARHSNAGSATRARSSGSRLSTFSIRCTTRAPAR